MPSPTDHSTALLSVLEVVRLMAALPPKSEDEVVEGLQDAGLSAVEAEKLNAFVPSAFSWVLLKRLGVSTFPSHYIALTRDGQEVELPVAQEHFFTAALRLAYETMEAGWTEQLSRPMFEAVLARSAEMAAANKALDAKVSLEGGSVQPLRIFRFSAEAAGAA